MIVSELRNIIIDFSSKVAAYQSKQIKRQKLGFRFADVFNNQSLLIVNVVADAVLKANEPLLETSKVRVPTWMTKKTFDSFISKLTTYADDNV